MSTVLERLYTEASLLAPDERALLALRLLESLEARTTLTAREIEAAWNDEAVRRLEAYRRDEIPTMSAEDVHAGVPVPRSG